MRSSCARPQNSDTIIDAWASARQNTESSQVRAYHSSVVQCMRNTSTYLAKVKFWLIIMAGVKGSSTRAVAKMSRRRHSLFERNAYGTSFITKATAGGHYFHAPDSWAAAVSLKRSNNRVNNTVGGVEPSAPRKWTNISQTVLFTSELDVNSKLGREGGFTRDVFPVT